MQGILLRTEKTVPPRNKSGYEYSPTLKTGTSVGGEGVFVSVNASGEKPVKYTDPDGKKVFLAYNRIHGYRTHGVKAPLQSKFYHATIVITDENNNVTHYIESGPKGGKNTKITDGSYASDRFASKGLTASANDGEWQKQFDGPVVGIDPSSLSPENFESNILSIAEGYNNQSDYAALPDKKKGTTNSNSFAFSTLRKALALPDGPIFTTPENSDKMAEDRAKVRPSVSELQVPGWDSDVK
jgi:hypothetical protein